MRQSLSLRTLLLAYALGMAALVIGLGLTGLQALQTLNQTHTRAQTQQIAFTQTRETVHLAHLQLNNQISLFPIY